MSITAPKFGFHFGVLELEEILDYLRHFAEYVPGKGQYDFDFLVNLQNDGWIVAIEVVVQVALVVEWGEAVVAGPDLDDIQPSPPHRPERISLPGPSLHVRRCSTERGEV